MMFSCRWYVLEPEPALPDREPGPEPLLHGQALPLGRRVDGRLDPPTVHDHAVAPSQRLAAPERLVPFHLSMTAPAPAGARRLAMTLAWPLRGGRYLIEEPLRPRSSVDRAEVS